MECFSCCLSCFFKVVISQNCSSSRVWLWLRTCKMDCCNLRGFLDPWSWPEKSYEFGSVCPSGLLSFCPFILSSGSFLGSGSLVLCSSVSGPCDDVRDRASFFEKNVLAPKMGQKCGFLNLLENLVINFIADTHSWKLKVDWKMLGLAWSKTGMTTMVSGL